MRTIHKAAIASAVAFWSFAFVVIAGTAAQAGPIVPRGHYCMTWDIRIAALRAMRSVWRPRQVLTPSAMAKPFAMTKTSPDSVH
jgi:hypothetical protein